MKYILKRSSLLFLLIISFITAEAQSEGSSLPNPNPRTSLKDMGVAGLQTTYTTGTFTLEEELVDGKRWQHIHLPGYLHLRNTGKPQLPVFTELVMVPEGAEFSWDYRHGATRKQEGVMIYPALAPATDRYGDPEPSFGYDTLAYNTNAFYPASPVQLVNVQEFRGMKLLWFDITPISFNPVTGELMIFGDVELDIRFQGASQFMDERQHSADFLRNFPLVGVNAPSVASWIHEHLESSGAKSSGGVIPASYIILTDSAFIDAANKFADWKRQLGYTTEIVAGYNWTYNTMVSAVHSRYAQYLPRPDYLLIIGDHDKMPAQMVYNPAAELYGTDLHLVTMGGNTDFIPEMVNGRISVNSAAQAMSVIDKIIQYEMNPPVDTTFYQTGINCAQFQDDDHDSYADRRFLHTSEDVRDYLLPKGYDIKRIYYASTSSSTPMYYNNGYYSNGQSLPAELLMPSFSWNGGPSHIISNINSGAFYVLHRDHGYAGGSGWHAPYFVSSNINSLSNGVKTPVVFSVNCHTGEFTLNECFAEKFLRHANGGAVGVVAASYYSYSGWNDGFTAGMFDAIWASPGLLSDYGSGGFANPPVSPHPDIRNMGRVVQQGLLRMTQTWSSSLSESQYTYRLFHYFGDPSMRIRTTTPAQMTASYSDSIHCSATAFTITGASYPDAVATLTLAGRLLGKVTLSNGSGSIPIDPFLANQLILTISGPEHIPVVDTIDVISDQLVVSHAVKNVSCRGTAQGEIQLFISCGVLPISVAWNHGPASHFVDGLTAGTYYYTVTDASNFSISDSVVVTQPSMPMQVSGNIYDVLCYYGNTGAIALQVTGGVPPYQYLWSNGQQADSVYQLISGNYSVSVTDSVGCVQIYPFTVDEPDPLQIGANITHDATGNCTGEATALPTGGTPPYTYLWNDPAAQTTSTVTGLCPGMVRVYVTDHHGCLTVKSVNIYNVSGIAEWEDHDLRVYPNPLTGDVLSIEFPVASPSGNLEISILNAVGQEILRRNIASREKTIHIHDFPPLQGVYLLIINDPETSDYLLRKIIRW